MKIATSAATNTSIILLPSYYRWLTTLSRTKRAPLLARMTQPQLRAYAAYIFNASGNGHLLAGWFNSFDSRKLAPDDLND